MTDLIDDRRVEAAYGELNKKENEHANGVVYFNCKTETTKLLERAKEIHKNGTLWQVSQVILISIKYLLFF